MNRSKIIALFLILCALISFSIVYVILGYYMNGHWGNSYKDLIDHHAVRARVLGMSHDKPGTPLITAPTVPWALIIGQVYYAGFLSLRTAQLLNFFLHIAVYIASAMLIYSCLKNFLTRYQIFLLCILPAAHFSYAYSMWFGNEAGIICLLMIDAILIVRRHPYIAGILISLCMCKPQIAGIICIMFLVRGHVKAVVIGAVICIAAWITASVITHTPMLKLLADCFNVGIYSANDNYTGLLHILTLTGFNKNLILAVNMLTGIYYMLIVYFFLKRNLHSELLMELAAYIPACIASTMWMYKNGGDYILLIYPAAFAVIMCTDENLKNSDFLKALICTGYLILSRSLVYFGIVVISRTNEARAIYKGIDSLMIMIIGIILCRMLVRYKRNEK